MKYDKCPKCGALHVAERWAAGRKLQQYCYMDEDDEPCGWVSEPRTPERLRITNSKKLCVDDFSGWDYIVYDKFGHTMTFSRTYSGKASAMNDLERELKRGETDTNAGPYTGVLFKTPSSIVITGKMFVAKKGKVIQVK